MTDKVDLSHINADIAEIGTKAQSVNEKNGELRALIKKKIDGRGYNSVALGMLRRIAKMSDEKYADFMRTFRMGLAEVTADRDGQIPAEMDLGETTSEPEGENTPMAAE